MNKSTDILKYVETNINSINKFKEEMTKMSTTNESDEKVSISNSIITTELPLSENSNSNQILQHYLGKK